MSVSTDGIRSAFPWPFSDVDNVFTGCGPGTASKSVGCSLRDRIYRGGGTCGLQVSALEKHETRGDEPIRISVGWCWVLLRRACSRRFDCNIINLENLYETSHLGHSTARVPSSLRSGSIAKRL